MKKILLFAVITSFLFVQACKEKEELPSATISFIAPLEHSTFHMGDTIQIEATIEATSPLHGWNLTITHGSDQSVLFQKDSHDHAQNLNIKESWVAAGNAGTIYVNLEAIINHDENKVNKSIELHIH